MTVKLEGLKDLNKALQELDGKLATKINRRAISRGAQVIRKEMRALAPRKTGDLRRELRYKIRKSKEKTGFSGSVGPTKKAFYARFIEFGTSAHEIPAPMIGSRRNRRANPAVVSFGGKVFSRVDHPGQRPQPFLRPAYMSSRLKALEAIKQRLWDDIRKEAARARKTR